MKRLLEKENGLELEKLGLRFSWDTGRNFQGGGGMMDIWTGKDRGRGGCGRDRGTEEKKTEKEYKRRRTSEPYS